MGACLCVCAHVCVHVCLCTCVCVCVYMCVCTRVPGAPQGHALQRGHAGLPGSPSPPHIPPGAIGVGAPPAPASFAPLPPRGTPRAGSPQTLRPPPPSLCLPAAPVPRRKVVRVKVVKKKVLKKKPKAPAKHPAAPQEPRTYTPYTCVWGGDTNHTHSPPPQSHSGAGGTGGAPRIHPSAKTWLCPLGGVPRDPMHRTSRQRRAQHGGSSRGTPAWEPPCVGSLSTPCPLCSAPRVPPAGAGVPASAGLPAPCLQRQALRPGRPPRAAQHPGRRAACARHVRGVCMACAWRVHDVWCVLGACAVCMAPAWHLHGTQYMHGVCMAHVF